MNKKQCKYCFEEHDDRVCCPQYGYYYNGWTLNAVATHLDWVRQHGIPSDYLSHKENV